MRLSVEFPPIATSAPWEGGQGRTTCARGPRSRRPERDMGYDAGFRLSSSVAIRCPSRPRALVRRLSGRGRGAGTGSTRACHGGRACREDGGCQFRWPYRSPGPGIPVVPVRRPVGRKACRRRSGGARGRGRRAPRPGERAQRSPLGTGGADGGAGRPAQADNQYQRQRHLLERGITTRGRFRGRRAGAHRGAGTGRRGPGPRPDRQRTSSASPP